MNYYEFHIGDYAAATQHLSDEEDLVYRRLLDVYYRDERPIPADLRAACRLARARTDEMRAAVEVVLTEYFVLAEDGWHNKHADEKLARHHAFLERQRANGRASAEKRSRNGGSTVVQPPLQESPTAVQPPLTESATVGQPPTSHYPLPTSQDGSNEPSPETARVPRFDPIAFGRDGLDAHVHAAWTDWIEHRRDRRHPLGEKVLRKHVEFLTRYAAHDQVEIINASIRANWQGLFAPKGPSRGNEPPISRADRTRAHLDRLIGEAEREERPLLASDDESVRPAVGGQLRVGTG